MVLSQSLKSIKPNPRILMNEMEIREIKTRVEKNEFSDIWKNTIKLAESYIVEQGFTLSYPSCSVTLDITLPLKQLEPIGDPPGYTDYPFWTMFSRAIEEIGRASCMERVL